MSDDDFPTKPIALFALGGIASAVLGMLGRLSDDWAVGLFLAHAAAAVTLYIAAKRDLPVVFLLTIVAAVAWNVVCAAYNFIWPAGGAPGEWVDHVLAPAGMAVALVKSLSDE